MKRSFDISDFFTKKPVQTTKQDAYSETLDEPGPSSSPVSDNSAISEKHLEGKLNNVSPHQPILPTYPMRQFGNQQRSFQKSWFGDHEWLEYDEVKDRCYCFPCRVFLTKTVPFNKSGYFNWKKAKQSKGGFKSHESEDHVIAMKLWEDRRNRTDSSSTVAHLVTNIENNREWVNTVFLMIKFLAKNGLPLRGDEELTDFDEGISGGLYLNTMNDLVFKLRPELARIAKNLPKNAKYTSDAIQNEVIEVLKDVVKNKIADEIKNTELFTLMVDGSSDKNFREIESIVARYIVDGDDSEDLKVVEHVVQLEELSDRSANGIFNLVKKVLKNLEISFDGMVSQCYDGASVMSGVRSGLQELISKFCQRFIVYIHCYCHRLHLALEVVLEDIQRVKDFFSTVTALYNFFLKSNVRKYYDGDRLKRLITTRWSGHRDAVSRIKSNYSDLLACLKLASENCNLDSSDRALAIGLMGMMKDEVFISLTYFLHEILQLVDIGNKILQSRGNGDILSALAVVKNVKNQIEDMKDKHCDEEVIAKCISREIGIEFSPLHGGKERKRPRSLPKKFNNSLITEHLPGEVEVRISSNSFSSRPLLIEITDLLVSELDRRFQDKNTALWTSMESLMPTSPSFLVPSALEVLFKYALSVPSVAKRMSGKTFQDLKSECSVFKVPLQEIEWEKCPSTKCIDIKKVANHVIKRYGSAAVILTQLYRVAIVAGYASVTNECSFSALQRIDSPQRRKMTAYRECNLTFLHFEKDMLESVTYEDFLKEWCKKTRKLAL